LNGDYRGGVTGRNGGTAYLEGQKAVSQGRLRETETEEEGGETGLGRRWEGGRECKTLQILSELRVKIIEA